MVVCVLECVSSLLNKYLLFVVVLRIKNDIISFISDTSCRYVDITLTIINLLLNATVSFSFHIILHVIRVFLYY